MTHNNEYVYTTFSCPSALVPCMPRGHSTLHLPMDTCASLASWTLTLHADTHTLTATWVLTHTVPAMIVYLPLQSGLQNHCDV